MLIHDWSGPFHWADWTSVEDRKGNYIPNHWKCRIGGFFISVYRSGWTNDTNWYCSCVGVCDEIALVSSDIDSAKSEALSIIRKVLSDALSDIP